MKKSTLLLPTILILALTLTGCSAIKDLIPGKTPPTSITQSPSPAPAQIPPEQEKAAIEERVKAFETAFFTIDYKKLNFDNALSFYTPNGKLEVKDVYGNMEQLLPRQQLVEKLDSFTLKSIELTSDSTATALYDVVASGTDTQGALTETSSIFTTMQKIDEQWFISQRTASTTQE